MAEQSVDVLVTEPVRRFLLDSWDSAGRVRLKVQPIGPTELQVPEQMREQVLDHKQTQMEMYTMQITK